MIELWRGLRDPRLSTTVVLMAALLAGFAALWLGYREVARIGSVPLQVPYIVSGGMLGIALIGAALGLLMIHINRVEQAAELELLQRIREEALHRAAGRAGE